MRCCKGVSFVVGREEAGVSEVFGDFEGSGGSDASGSSLGPAVVGSCPVSEYFENLDGFAV